MQEPNYNYLTFMKMHGLGNDFVVVDERGTSGLIDADTAVAIGDRHRGVGFDQLAVISEAQNADFHLKFWNSDGSQSSACGNATRCIARHFFDQSGQTSLLIATDHGVLQAVDTGDGLTSVNMGPPEMGWNEIPLAEQMNTLSLPIEGTPTATGMGNPHCTFFVDDAEAVELADLGPKIENHPLFPDRTNVQFATVTGTDKIRMRVWERGVGITLASGSSSCATAVAAARKGLTGRKVEITLDGGRLWVDWREDGVWMTGETAHVFDGTWYL